MCDRELTGHVVLYILKIAVSIQNLQHNVAYWKQCQQTQMEDAIKWRAVSA